MAWPLLLSICMTFINGEIITKQKYNLLTTSSFNHSINLDFEGIGNLQPVGDFYAQYHIIFSSDALAIVAQYAGGNGNFAGEPTPVTAMTFTSGKAYMNIPGNVRRTPFPGITAT